MSNEPIQEEIAAARSVAEHMAALGGPDLRNLTDTELVVRLKEAGRKMQESFAKAALTANEAANALARFGEAARLVQPKVPNSAIDCRR